MLSFQEFLNERVLSPGINPSHDQFREKYRQEIHDMIRNAYAPLHGYAGWPAGSKQESDAIHADISSSAIKMTIRNGRVSSVNLYKNQHGRKSVASATDGTPQGKKDFAQNKLEDHEQKRAWGEVSGRVEAIMSKLGVPAIPAHIAKELIGKDVDIQPDGYHYSRKIGGSYHTKIAVGHPKIK